VVFATGAAAAAWLADSGLARDEPGFVAVDARLRSFYLLAYDHARSLGVLRVVLRAVFGFYRRGANRGMAVNARTGSMTFVQRFGSAANLNLHFHILVLDGVKPRRLPRRARRELVLATAGRALWPQCGPPVPSAFSLRKCTFAASRAQEVP
jgi:hypothetical protein